LNYYRYTGYLDPNHTNGPCVTLEKLLYLNVYIGATKYKNYLKELKLRGDD